MKLRPTTNRDPLLRQIFTEQERLRLPNSRLAGYSGLSERVIHDLRHPTEHNGKRATLVQVRALALALDFEFPARLIKH